MSPAALAAGVVVVCLVVVCLVAPAPASAHLRSGTVAVDYRARVASSVTPAYRAQIYQSDHGLSLTLRRGHVVTMLGYLGEPVFRLDAAGLWVNAASPTALAMHLVSRGRGVGGATPHWRLRRGRHTVVWHDARVQGLPPGVEAGRWDVPLLIDGHRAGIRGELRRFPDPSPWVWLAILAAWLGLGVPPLVTRGRDQARRGAIVFALIATAAAALTAMAFALDAYASPGTWIEALDVMAFLAVGLAVMWRGPRNLHVAAAIWVGLVSAAVALLDGPVFLHPIVLAVLPAVTMRLLVVTALGAGLSAAAIASTQLSQIAEAVRDHERVLARATASPRSGARSARDRADR
ncbi:MAG: hypothetical protein ACXVSE_08280 [Solirubrobacteraceae bacterium]